MNKIIIVGPAFPLRGGLATFNERMARQMKIEGYDTSIFTFSLQYPDFLFPGVTQYAEGASPEDVTIHVCINSINPINWIKTGFKIKNENADVVIFRYWIPFMAPALGTIARIIKINKHTEVVALVDNALPHEKRWGDKLLTTYFIRPFDRFITMSGKVLNDLKAMTSKPIRLISHPLYDNFGDKEDIKSARQHLGLPEDGKILLFFGFIRKYKGLDILIKALDSVDMSDKYLLIAGEYYADEQEIKSLIQQSGVKDRIIEHTHFINNDEVRWYFSAADIIIQPYRNATQSGVTPLAYHFEVPMIVTDVGALKDLVPPELGKVCKPDADDLADSINSMKDFDIPLFKKVIRTEKQKLSWEVLVQAVTGINPENPN